MAMEGVGTGQTTTTHGNPTDELSPTLRLKLTTTGRYFCADGLGSGGPGVAVIFVLDHSFSMNQYDPELRRCVSPPLPELIGSLVARAPGTVSFHVIVFGRDYRAAAFEGGYMGDGIAELFGGVDRGGTRMAGPLREAVGVAEKSLRSGRLVLTVAFTDGIIDDHRALGDSPKTLRRLSKRDARDKVAGLATAPPGHESGKAHVIKTAEDLLLFLQSSLNRATAMDSVVLRCGSQRTEFPVGPDGTAMVPVRVALKATGMTYAGTDVAVRREDAAPDRAKITAATLAAINAKLVELADHAFGGHCAMANDTAAKIYALLDEIAPAMTGKEKADLETIRARVTDAVALVRANEQGACENLRRAQSTVLDMTRPKIARKAERQTKTGATNQAMPAFEGLKTGRECACFEHGTPDECGVALANGGTAAPPDVAIRTAHVAVHDGTGGPAVALPKIAKDDLAAALGCYKSVLGMLATNKEDVTSSHLALFLAWAMAFERAGKRDVASIFRSWFDVLAHHVFTESEKAYYTEMASNWNGFAQVQASSNRFKPGSPAMLCEYGRVLGGFVPAPQVQQLHLILQRIELAKRRGLRTKQIRELAGSAVEWSVALKGGKFVAERAPFDVAAVWHAILPLLEDALFETRPPATGSAQVLAVDPTVAATLKGLCAILMACGSTKDERLLCATAWGPEDRRLTTVPESIVDEVRAANAAGKEAAVVHALETGTGLLGVIGHETDLYAFTVAEIEERSRDNDGGPRLLSPRMFSALLELWQQAEMLAADRSRLVLLVELQLCLMASTDPSLLAALDWVPPLAAIGAYNRVAADGGDEPNEDALEALREVARRNFTAPRPGSRNFARAMGRYARLVVPRDENDATAPVTVVPMGAAPRTGRRTCYLPGMPTTSDDVHVRMMWMVNGSVTGIRLVDGETLEVPTVNTPKGKAGRPVVRPSWKRHPRFVRAAEVRPAPVAAASRLGQAVANATEARDAAE